MTSDDAGSFVEAVLAGDPAGVAPLTRFRTDELHATLGRSEFVLKHDAVVAVLTKLASGDITPAQANAWGTLVFWGVIETSDDKHDTGLTFWYEEAYDDSIATAVMRLEQIGDLVDGVVSPAECAQLLARLRRPDQSDAGSNT